MMDFSVTLDPLSLAALQRFEAPDLLPGAVQADMGYAGRIVLYRMQMYMSERFKSPTGQLAGSLQVIQDSPYEVSVGSPLPYAWRREEGFSGHTDALGRYYPYDPGIHYGADALSSSEEEIALRLASTIDASFARGKKVLT